MRGHFDEESKKLHEGLHYTVEMQPEEIEMFQNGSIGQFYD